MGNRRADTADTIPLSSRSYTSENEIASSSPASTVYNIQRVGLGTAEYTIIQYGYGLWSSGPPSS